MKIDFSQSLLGLDGQVLQNNGVALTLGTVSVDSLVLVRPDENIKGDEKFKRYQIARKIHGEAEVELAIEQVALIKKLIGKSFGPAVVGPAFELLETPKKKK